MITDADVKKLGKTFVTKDHLAFVVSKLATKKELQELKSEAGEIKENTDKILVSIDKIFKKFDEMEYPAFKADIKNHDRQIKKLAEAANVDVDN